MTDLVDPDVIESIVGARRHKSRHIAAAVTADDKVYILHSADCKNRGKDLRDCPYSRALDNGVEPSDWRKVQDQPVVIRISATGDRIVPMLSESRFINRIE